MSFTIPAPIGPLPELESKPSRVGRLVTRLRSLAEDVAEVQRWAERRSADGAGWTGDAAEAADHESTRFSRRLEPPEAALYAASAAAEVLEDAVTVLAADRADLDARRVALNDDIAGATEALRSWSAADPIATVALGQARATAVALTLRALHLRAAIDTWTNDVARAEEAFVASLRSVDTVAEAGRVVDQVKAEETARGQVRGVVDGLIGAGVLPLVVRGLTAEQLAGYVRSHPAIAARLVANDPREGAPGLEGIIAGHPDREQARSLFEGMRPADAALFAQLYPDEIGNLSGVPFAYRADANLVHVIDQLDRIDHVPDHLVSDDLAATRELYRSIVEGERQIVLFDPAHERIAELHGQIGPDTRNVGVHVPGTKSDIAGFDEIAERSSSFVNARYQGDLAVVTWLGGEFPPSVLPYAADGSYADDLGLRLADFSHDVRQEIEHAGADARTTYLGHSYGGAVVGTAEQSGLDADRVLHVESAGMGKGVDEPGDLPPSQADVARYSMTAPGDFIGYVQGASGGHGADPDEFDGVTRLETGDYADGRRVDGLFESHSGVFEVRSGAWKNMYETLIGGTVTTDERTDTVVVPAHIGPYAVPGLPSVEHVHHPSERIDIP